MNSKSYFLALESGPWQIGWPHFSIIAFALDRLAPCCGQSMPEKAKSRTGRLFKDIWFQRG
jgi:hypothetical protein